MITDRLEYATIAMQHRGAVIVGFELTLADLEALSGAFGEPSAPRGLEFGLATHVKLMGIDHGIPLWRTGLGRSRVVGHMPGYRTSPLDTRVYEEFPE